MRRTQRQIARQEAVGLPVGSGGFGAGLYLGFALGLGFGFGLALVVLVAGVRFLVGFFSGVGSTGISVFMVSALKD